MGDEDILFWEGVLENPSDEADAEWARQKLDEVLKNGDSRKGFAVCGKICQE